MGERKPRSRSGKASPHGGISAVARIADVSVATVSRIFSSDGKSAAGYSETTRARVLEAARTLQYAPNIHARRLVRGRADHVALIVRHLQSAFFAELADHFVRSASEMNLRFSLDLADPTEEATVSAVKNFGGDMVDAVFVCPSYPSMSFEQIKVAARCPIVCLVHKPSDREVPFISFDLVDAARQGTHHLLSLGRRRIGYVGGADEGDGRFKGFLDALEEWGIASNPDWIICDNLYRSESAFTAGEKLSRLPVPPDALFVASDSMAMAVISGLSKNGMHVPDDVAVVSHNGDKVGAYFRPALTTMALPLPRLVDHSLAMVQAIYSGKTKDDVLAMSTELKAELVIRDSCGSKAQGIS